jgi:uracil-DNA glycosylase family 4
MGQPNGVAREPRLPYAGIMSEPQKDDPLAALAWLVESGAEETIGEVPVNRLVAKTAAASHPPLEGGSKTRSVLGEGSARSAVSSQPRTTTYPSPKSAAPISTLPQGEGGKETDSIGSAMSLAAAATTLAELKAALEGFDGGTLKKNAAHTVFADGNPAARILLIGEAPGAEEDRQGLPFVGRAGKLLDKMLAAIELDRTTAYITNVLNWRPPQNRDPSPEEAAMCLPFLRRHIELMNPGIIILLGAVAAKHVLGFSEGIMKLRGRWLEYRVGDVMIPVMATLHPAYLLRQPAHKKLAWRDLQAIEKKILALGLLEKTAPVR